MRLRRSVSSIAEPIADRSAGPLGRSRAINSSSVRSTASGLRSSWLASETNVRSRPTDVWMRASISLRVRSSLPNSSLPPAGARRSARFVAEIAAARRRIASTGRSAPPVSRKPAIEASTSAAGPPSASTPVRSLSARLRSSSDTPTTTVIVCSCARTDSASSRTG